MRAVDHDGLISGAFGSQGLEGALEDSSVRSGCRGACEARGRRVRHATSGAVSDDVDDAADDLSVIDARDASDLVGQEGVKPGN